MIANNQVQVWDQFVRVFHWSLLPLFFVAYITGDDKGPLHRYAGYAVLGLVIARVCWGLWGTKHARFNDFVCSPAKAIAYIKNLSTGKSVHFIGHNPAAAWMIILFLANSVVICLSGYAAYATKAEKPSFGFIDTSLVVGNAYADDDKHDARKTGKHAKENEARKDGHSEKDDDDGDSVWSDIHESSAQLMLILIFLHVIGVAVSSKMHNENLVKAMFTGKKSIHQK